MSDNSPNDLAQRLDALRDLSDFCIEWPHIRKLLAERREPGADPGVEAALKWLTLLADRVCLSGEL